MECSCSLQNNNQTECSLFTTDVHNAHNHYKFIFLHVHSQHLPPPPPLTHVHIYYQFYILRFFSICFSFFQKTTYCCRTRRLPICLSVCLSVHLSSVEIICFRGNLISNRPIDLEIDLTVR